MQEALKEERFGEADLCSLMIIVEKRSVLDGIQLLNHRGSTVIELQPLPPDENSTSVEVPEAIKKARQVRLSSWCLTVLVVSDDIEFLEWLAEVIQKGRLLVWNTRLLVLSRIVHSELLRLLSGYWTFAMMSTVFVNQMPNKGPGGLGERWGIYTHLPYSERDGQVMQLASWTPKGGIFKYTHLPLFAQKFKSFHGAAVNVTALPFSPYWDEEVEERDGKVVKKYSGMDYLMLDAIAASLNFRIHVLPTNNWNEVTLRVEERVSFLAPIIYAVFPRRLEEYDYSYTFEYALSTFAMAKPALKPQWQSLYYPLSDQVWLSILITLVLMPLPLHLLRHGPHREESKSAHILDSVIMVWGTFLSQNISKISKVSSYRFLLCLWLVFAFIVGSAYRGNLTASLTLPKYPPRPETLEELVKTGSRAGMASYGAHFKQFFVESTSPVFQAIGQRFDIVPTAQDGLTRTIMDNFAYIDARRFLELQIARKFTAADGSTALYLAREGVFPGLSGWPFPHDAPYKHVFDAKILSIIEAGLYQKWSQDMVEKARQEGRLKARQEAEKRKSEMKEEEEKDTSTSDVLALTLVHMQGPFFILALGWVSSFLTLAVEVVWQRTVG